VGSTASVDTDLRWTAADPDDDPLTFDVYFGTSYPASLLVEDHGDTVCNPGKLEYDNPYYWKVVAKDDKGHSTEGPDWFFTTAENEAPDQPSNPSPCDGCEEVAVTVTLSWDASDPDQDSLYYDVYLGTTDDPPLVVQQAGSSYKPEQDLGFGTDYYWKIVVHDEYANQTSGPVWHFKTGINGPPDDPFDPVPEDGAINRALDLDLRWKASDPENDPLLFDVYLGRDDPPTGVLATDISETTYEVSNRDYATTYYWQVVVRDDHGNEREGAVWRFTTKQNQPPNPPANPSPSDGEIDVALDVQLRWTGSDPEGDPLRYDVYLCTDNPPMTRVAQDIAEHEYVHPGGLDFSATYYWRIVAKDDYSNQQEGPVWHFSTIANAAPDSPSAPSPADGATDVAIDVSLQWTCSDPEGDLLLYDVYLSKDNPPMTRVAQDITEQEYVHPGGLQGSATYYWRIVAKDDYANQTQGPVWYFTVATTPDVEWERMFGGSMGDIGKSVQQTSDGGYIVAGSTSSIGAGDSDVYLIKVTSAGSEQWETSFGSAYGEYGRSVQQTSDGGYIIAGDAYSLIAGLNDVYLVKADAAGGKQWEKRFSAYPGGIPGQDSDDRGYSVEQSSDGGYIIAGWTHSLVEEQIDVYLIKVNSDGSKQWDKTLGGTGDDYGYSVQQTTDGGYVIAGETSSSGAGADDIYLVKVDAGGAIEWERAFGGAADDVGYSVQQTTDGGYIIAGSTWSFGTGAHPDVYLVKVDAGGAIEWEKTFGGTLDDRGYSVDQTTDGGYIVTGLTSSFDDKTYADVYLVKVGAAGSKQWEKTFGGAMGYDSGESVRQTSDGGYIVAGYTYSFAPGDVYLIKVAGP
jgi:hypothetical protein